MIVELHTTIEGVKALEREWRAMEQQMVQLPFVMFDWVIAWWGCLRSDRFLVRDSLHFLSFRTAAGVLCGVVPLMMTTRPGIGPLRMRQLQFIGADTNLTELRCIAAAESDAESVYAAFVDYVRERRLPCDWMKFTGIDNQKQIEHIKANFGELKWSREVPVFILRLKPTWEEFKNTLPRNIKESLRKCYNAPKRDGIELELVVVTGGPDLEHAVDELLRLHATRSELTDTVTHLNAFRLPGSREFLHQVCQRFSVQGRLRIFQLKHNGTVIATRIGFVCNDSLYLYYSGFDPAYAQYSVMTRVVAEAIQDSISLGLATVNLSIGRDVSKERWRPEESAYHEAEVVAGSRWSAMKYRFFRATSSALKRS